jgi:hypothetical protein
MPGRGAATIKIPQDRRRDCSDQEGDPKLETEPDMVAIDLEPRPRDQIGQQSHGHRRIEVVTKQDFAINELNGSECVISLTAGENPRILSAQRARPEIVYGGVPIGPPQCDQDEERRQQPRPLEYPPFSSQPSHADSLPPDRILNRRKRRQRRKPSLLALLPPVKSFRHPTGEHGRSQSSAARNRTSRADVFVCLAAWRLGVMAVQSVSVPSD